MPMTIEPLTGAALTAALPDLARLRITVFRDWPYLYDGSLEFERTYLAKFASGPDSLIVVARDGNEIVGASTASPLMGLADELAPAFREHGIQPETIFYFGESVLLPQFRGQGAGNAFFQHREARARELGRFAQTAFCVVIRPAGHPLRPTHHRPLDGFWIGRGYRRVEGLTTSFIWKDIGQARETSKAMQFWIRAL